MKRFKRRKNSGITLIALVITIVVLLILAAVSIATLTGQNGILTQANNAKEQTVIGEEKEQVGMAYVAATVNSLGGNITNQNLQNELDKLIGTGKTKVKGESPFKIKFQDTKHYYKINNGIVEVANPPELKTIAELYDGINDTTDINYNNNAMHIGDYVNYTAGTWNETKEVPTTEGEFGGYTEGQSRDINATGSCNWTYDGVTYGIGKYEGWRIWDISEDKKTMTLISAGCPEVFYHEWRNPNGLVGNSENILLGETSKSIHDDYLYTPRSFNEYVNNKQYASYANCISYNDFILWYRKYIDSNVNDFFDYDHDYIYPKANENKLISTFDNGFYYWVPGYTDEQETSLCCIFQEGDNYFCSFWGSSACGIRILITLNESVKFEEDADKIEQDGYTYNKWNIN